MTEPATPAQAPAAPAAPSKWKKAAQALFAWATSRQGRAEIGVVVLAVYDALHRAGV